MIVTGVLAAIPNNTLRDNTLVITDVNVTGAYQIDGVDIITGAGDADLVSVNSYEYYLNSVNKTDVVAFPETETSYIIFTDGTNYYAKNGATGINDFSGANWITVAQAAIDLGGKIVFKGNFIKTVIPAISVPSDTEIEILTGYSMSFDDNVGNGAIFFSNSNFSAGNSNIKISGVLDGNGGNQGVDEQIAIQLRNCSSIQIDCAIRDVQGINIDSDEATNYQWFNPDYPLSSEKRLTKQDWNIDRIENLGWRKDWLTFETNYVWTGSGARDTTEVYPPRNHSSSWKITVAASGGITTINLLNTNTSRNALMPKHGYRIMVKVNDTTRLTSNWYWSTHTNDLFSGVGTKTNRCTLSGISTLVADEWMYVYTDGYAFLDYSDTVDSKTAFDTGLRMDIAAGDSPVTIWIDHVDVVPPIFPYGVISIGCDGTRAQTRAIQYPLLREYMFQSTQWIDHEDYTTEDMEAWLDMQNNGDDIALHNRVYLNTVTLAEAEISAMAELEAMLEFGFTKADYMNTIFGGLIDDPILGYTEFFKTIRGTGTISYHILPPVVNTERDLVDAKVFVGRALGSLDAGLMTSTKESINQCEFTGRYTIYYNHGYEAGFTAVRYRELLEYIKNSGILVLPVSKVLSMFEGKENVYEKEVVTDFYPSLYNDSTKDYIVSAEDCSAALPIIATIDNQPGAPRTLIFNLTHTAITAARIEIVGTDARGMIRTYVHELSDATGWTLEVRLPFLTITSIKITERTGTGIGDILNVGLTDGVGLSNICWWEDDIIQVTVNGVATDITYFDYTESYIEYDGLVTADDNVMITYRTGKNIMLGSGAGAWETDGLAFTDTW